ncbi:hypothetical protein Pmar_PMAR009094, partial [Perkinsus marinus ATCC 50983]
MSDQQGRNEKRTTTAYNNPHITIGLEGKQEVGKFWPRDVSKQLSGMYNIKLKHLYSSKQEESPKYRVYQCDSHEDCQFKDGVDRGAERQELRSQRKQPQVKDGGQRPVILVQYARAIDKHGIGSRRRTKT